MNVKRLLSIGEIAKLSGVSVRRIRFYSDAGLLPPAARSEANYRGYTHDDVARLDLIRSLRDAGIGLETIGRTLSEGLSLTDVLTIRLQALEAEIASRRRIAAVLRATLADEKQPTETSLRRLWTVTTLSNTRLRQTIENFYDQVAAGARMGDDWKRQMVDAATPELPAEPTPAQIDAWTELAAMLGDPAFIASMRAEAAGMWNGEFDPAAYAQAANATLARVRAAIAARTEPASEAGRAIAQDWLAASAKAMRRAPDAEFLAWQLGQYRKHHARSARYQELMAVLRGEDAGTAAAQGTEWRWIHEAMTPLLGAAA